MATPDMTTNRDTGLRHDYLSFPEVLAQSVANIAPTAATAVTIALVTGIAGNGTWLSYLLATIGMVIVGLNVGQFARRIASAGSFYNWVCQSLGSLGGLLTGWGLLLGYIGVGWLTAVGFGLYLGALLFPDSQLSPWVYVLFFAICCAITGFFAWRDIKLSSLLALVLEFISIGLILILALLVFFSRGLGDANQWTLVGTDLGAIQKGVVLAILAFVGFESAAALGAEAKNPFRSIPRAVLWSAAIVGLFYILMSYTQLLAFKGQTTILGEDGQPIALAASTAPLNDIAKIVGVEFYGKLIDIGIVISMFACNLACVNAGARMLFTLSRDGVLPSHMGQAHSTNQTPHIAVLVSAILIFAVPAVAVATGTGLLDFLTWFGTYSTLGFIIAYLLVSVAAPIYLARVQQANPVPVVIGVLGALLMVWVFWGQLDFSNLTATTNVIVYWFVAYMVIGLVVYLVVRMRSPEVVGRMGQEIEPSPSHLI